MDLNTSLENLLLQIPIENVEQVHTILQWLAFGDEPILQSRFKQNHHLLSLEQLVETSILSLNNRSMDANRYIRPAELQQLLGELVELEEAPRKRWINDEQPVTVIRLKDEIREELLSETFRRGAASQFGFDESQAKETIAITCLILLTESEIPAVEAKAVTTADRYSLVQYAALFWIDVVNIGILSSTLFYLVHKLFLGDSNIFKRWTELLVAAGDMYLNSKHSQLISSITNYSHKKTGEHAPPIVWAAAFNLKQIVEELLSQRTPVNAAGSGSAVSALYMAVHQKHYDMAALLLDTGGDVADQYQELIGKYEYGSQVSPLYLACHRCYPREWIDLLLKDKSKIGRLGWRLEVGMKSAARFGGLHCLEALIEAGADPSKGTGHEKSYGCPLQAACDGGNENVVSFLLEKGADPNTTGGNICEGNVHTPLQMAAYRYKLSVVKLLLEYGADPNIQGGDLRNALIAAIWNQSLGSGEDGRLAVVELLLQSGARAEEEWDMTTKLHDLIFEHSGNEKKPLNERFDATLAEWIASKDYDKRDMSPGSEASLRRRINEKWARIHEGRRQNKLGYMCGSMNKKAYTTRFRPLRKIRLAGALISSRLHEAGISPSIDSYKLNAIQTAIVMERPSIVALLQEHGVETPAVIVPSAAQSVEDAESIARVLRQKTSFHYSTRMASGEMASSGGGTLP
ncbi:MAG: hypothetical protein Q9198_006997 [Flavoplaca austrocitrina]